MTNITTPTPDRADAPREAVPCWMIPARAFRAVSVYPEDGTGKPVVETDVPALAIDNDTGGGLVARVRAAVDGVVQRSVPTQYAPSEGDLCWLADDLVAAVTRALGVQP